MDESTRLLLGVGALALVALVGIYYIGIRKAVSPEEPAASQSPKAPQ